jgi:hypothetical protein
VLLDCHAEVVAPRSLLLWLYQQAVLAPPPHVPLASADLTASAIGDMEAAAALSVF